MKLARLAVLAVFAGGLLFGCVLPFDSTYCEPRRRLTITEAAQFAYDAGFTSQSELESIVAIGIAESSLITNNRNEHPEFGPRNYTGKVCVADSTPNDGQLTHVDRGLWQISSRAWPQYSDPQTDHPETAAWIARQLYLNAGEGFFTWDVWDNGIAQRHVVEPLNGWPAVRPIIQDFLN